MASGHRFGHSERLSRSACIDRQAYHGSGALADFGLEAQRPAMPLDDHSAGNREVRDELGRHSVCRLLWMHQFDRVGATIGNE